LAQQRRLAERRLGDAQQDLHHRRLAGAVLAQQAEDFALLDAERHALERLDLAVLLGEVLDFDDGHGPLSRDAPGDRVEEQCSKGIGPRLSARGGIGLSAPAGPGTTRRSEDEPGPVLNPGAWPPGASAAPDSPRRTPCCAA